MKLAALIGLVVTIAIRQSALAQEASVVEPPIVEALGERFAVIVLDQPDRDLLNASPRVNLMFDTRTGRSWILEYSRKPNSNEQGYVWVEVPFAPPAKAATP
jgi:hypothetical protein